MELIELGKRIHQRRTELKITSDQLSEKCDITPTYLRAIECGNKTPSLPVFVKICNALDISPEFILRADLHITHTEDINELRELFDKMTPKQAKIIRELVTSVMDYLVVPD